MRLSEADFPSLWMMARNIIKIMKRIIIKENNNLKVKQCIYKNFLKTMAAQRGQSSAAGAAEERRVKVLKETHKNKTLYYS